MTILENEIISSWKNKENIVVSVSIITFNHAKYIEKTINSILKQKTTFRFEILIHDDASEDETSIIIEKYKKKFPNIIFPIYQTENQYNFLKKNVSPNNPPLNYVNFKRARGEFIAMCDGDDFWQSENKLEIQVMQMRNHKNIDVSFHGLNIFNYKNKKNIEKLISKKNKIFNTNKVIFYHHRLYTSTVTMMIRKRLVLNLPEFYFKVPTEDFYLLLFGSKRGGALYISKVLSTYNLFVPNSWSSKKRNPNHYLYNVKTLFDVKKYYKFSFFSVITFVILEFYLKYLILKTLSKIKN